MKIAEDLQPGVALRTGTSALPLVEVGSADRTEAKTVLPAQKLSRQEKQNTLPHLVGNIQRPPEEVHLDRHEALVGSQTGVLAQLQPGRKIKIQQIIRYCKGCLPQTARTGALGPEGQGEPYGEKRGLHPIGLGQDTAPVGDLEMLSLEIHAVGDRNVPGPFNMNFQAYDLYNQAVANTWFPNKVQ